eukprot:TRINITY_DN3868_c0_g2_i1.p1 TRINITY_DN3868_c0_g2~~TRINITY_DN3868_c0_g2_i1.p1  ORF type:complete len:361 (+),score=93.35 TRINITY_DN3868_c0_g2_i1:118-1083(+)
MASLYSNQRIGIKVAYLCAGSHTAAGCALHFFQVTEKNKKVGLNGRPSRRMLVLVDRQSFLSDVDAALSRSVMISKIELMYMFEEDMRLLSGPMTPYDMLLQGSALLDFIRTVGAIFKPNDPAAPVPMFELEENQPIAARVNCRTSTIAQEDTYAKRQGDEVIRRLRETNSREVASLKEALQRQRDETLHELVDLQTQNEQLKHTLAQTENLLIEFKRQAKEQRLGYASSFQPEVPPEGDRSYARRLGSPTRLVELPDPGSSPQKYTTAARDRFGSPHSQHHPQTGLRPPSPIRAPTIPTRSPGALSPDADIFPRYTSPRG